METQEEFEQRKSDDIQEKTAIVNELRGLVDKQDTVLSKTAALRKPLKGLAADLSSAPADANIPPPTGNDIGRPPNSGNRKCQKCNSYYHMANWALCPQYTERTAGGGGRGSFTGERRVGHGAGPAGTLHADYGVWMASVAAPIEDVIRSHSPCMFDDDFDEYQVRRAMEREASGFSGLEASYDDFAHAIHNLKLTFADCNECGDIGVLAEECWCGGRFNVRRHVVEIPHEHEEVGGSHAKC